MWRSGASGCGLKGSLQASHQWSVTPFCLPQISQLKVSVQVTAGPSRAEFLIFLMSISLQDWSVRATRFHNFLSGAKPKLLNFISQSRNGLLLRSNPQRFHKFFVVVLQECNICWIGFTA